MLFILGPHDETWVSNKILFSGQFSESENRMRTSKSKTMYLCDCWIEAYEFVVRFNSEEMIKVEFIGDVLDVASNYHAKTNMLIWRFLKRNPCYYLTEAGEPVALAQKWLKIPSKNLEIAGNNMYILRNGILGEGDREQICSDETYMTEVLGAAKGRPIVVISTDWKKFILRQAPDAQIDLETPEGGLSESLCMGIGPCG